MRPTYFHFSIAIVFCFVQIAFCLGQAAGDLAEIASSQSSCLEFAKAVREKRCEPSQTHLYDTLKATCEARRQALHCDQLLAHASAEEKPQFFACDDPNDLCEQITTSTKSKIFSCGMGIVHGVILDPFFGIIHLGSAAWEVVRGRGPAEFPTLISSCPDTLDSKKVTLGDLRPKDMTDETLSKMSCTDVRKFGETKAEVVLRKLEQRRQSEMAKSGRENLNVYDMSLSEREKAALNFDQSQTGAAGKARCFRPIEAAQLVCQESASSATAAAAMIGLPLAGAKLASKLKPAISKKAAEAAAPAGAGAAAAASAPLAASAPSAAAATATAASEAAAVSATTSPVVQAVTAPAKVAAAAPKSLKPTLSAEEIAAAKELPTSRLKRMKRFAQKTDREKLEWDRIDLEQRLGRPLTPEELEAAYFVRHGGVGNEALSYLDLVKSLSSEEKFEILNSMTKLESTQRRMEDFYFASANAYNKSRNVTSASLDRAGEKTFSSLESRLQKAEDKFRFSNASDESQFFYFRRLTQENLDELAKGSDLAAVRKAAQEGTIDLRAPMLGDYQRVLSVANDLGTPKFKNFNKRFGHVDTEPGSNLFSLRLRPTFEVKGSGQIKADARPDLRALLCKTADGTIRIFKVYRKESFVSEAAFAAAEKEYYAAARSAVASGKIGCLKPNP